MPQPIIHGEMARVEELYVTGPEGVTSAESLKLSINGVSDPEHNIVDKHFGLTRTWHPYQVDGGWEGSHVVNDRQVSLVLADDLTKIADGLGILRAIVDGRVDEAGEVIRDVPRYMAKILGANILLGNGLAADSMLLKNFIGPGTKLFLGEPEKGGVITVNEAILPCSTPAELLFAKFPESFEDTRDAKDSFKQVAYGLRGYTGSVFVPGTIAVGDSVSLQQPVDHRVLIPGWDVDLGAAELLDIGILDLPKLGKLAGLSAADVKNTLQSKGLITIYPLSGEEQAPGSIDEVLSICGIGGMDWQQYLTLIPGGFQYIDDQVPVPEGYFNDAHKGTAGQFIDSASYYALDVESAEEGMAVGRFTFENGHGLTVDIQASNSFTTDYDENDEASESETSFNPNFVIKIGLSDSPKFGTIVEDQ